MAKEPSLSSRLLKFLSTNPQKSFSEDEVLTALGITTRTFLYSYSFGHLVERGKISRTSNPYLYRVANSAP